MQAIYVNHPGLTLAWGEGGCKQIALPSNSGLWPWEPLIKKKLTGAKSYKLAPKSAQLGDD